MSDLLVTLWPLFALIVAGWAFKRIGFPGDAFWPGADKINYFVLFPALLFSSLANAPLDDPALFRLAGAILVVLGLATAGFHVMRRRRQWPAARFGPLVQGAIRFNTYLGLALVGSLYGAPGIAVAGVVIAVMVPSVNVLSVIALTPKGETGIRSLVRSLLTNPLILACLAGIAVALFGGKPGLGIDRFVALLASASLPLGLLCVGAALRPAALGAETPTLFANGLMRLLVMPVLAFAVARLTALEGLQTEVLVIFFALPTAPTAYVLTMQLKGDAGLMAGLVTLQTVLAGVTLPFVLAMVV